MSGGLFCSRCGAPVARNGAESADSGAWERVLAVTGGDAGGNPAEDALSRALFGEVDAPPSSPAQSPGDPGPKIAPIQPEARWASPAGSSDDADRPGPSWPRALLASYASAVTLACFWLWWSRGPAPAESNVASADVPRGETDRTTFRVEPPAPLPDDRRVVVGTRLPLGLIDVTPIAIELRPVVLVRERIDGQLETKEGAGQALWLRLRVRNNSADHVFKPLDERFVRQPDRRLPDCFIEAPDGERVYGFPLPVRSEWTIDQQVFPALRPGESAEMVVVSDRDPLARIAGRLRWRVRVRSGPGPDQTDQLEVQFNASDVREVDAPPPDPA